MIHTNYFINLELSHSSVNSSKQRISNTLVNSASLTNESLLPAYIICNSGLQSAEKLELVMSHIECHKSITLWAAEYKTHWVGNSAITMVQSETVY